MPISILIYGISNLFLRGILIPFNLDSKQDLRSSVSSDLLENINLLFSIEPSFV